MWLPFDGDFDALGWNRAQTTNGTFEVGVTNALKTGTAGFPDDMLNLRIVDGNKSTLRKRNEGCLSLNGGYVDLAFTQFLPDIYDALTIEFFFKANFADKSWLAMIACRHDKIKSGNTYFENRLPFCFQENGSGGVNCRTDTPERENANVAIPKARNPFDGNWHHVALTIVHDAEHAHQTITAYLDYENIATSSVNGVFTVNDYHFLRFGQKDKDTSVMLLDEFRVSRGALPVSAFMRQAGAAGMSIIFR